MIFLNILIKDKINIMKNDTIEKQYKNYISVIKLQLDFAKSQIKRIPKLEKVSNLSLEEFKHKYKKNGCVKP